ncbi:MAG TPA: hypothetical protein VF384_13070 [Planctomycetota bacterium]
MLLGARKPAATKAARSAGSARAVLSARFPLLLPELPLALVWFSFALVAAARFPFHGLWHDDAICTALGRSLWAGDYCMEQLPGCPVETRYPPLHPAVLGLCWQLGASPDSAWLFAIPGLVIAACGLVLWGQVLRLHLDLGPAQRLAVLTLAAFAPAWLQVVQCAMAEPWVFTLLPLALLVLGRTGEGRPALAGAILGLCAQAKSTAVLPLLAITGQLLLQRRARAASRFVLAGLLVTAPWWSWIAWHGDAGESRILRYYSGYGALLCSDAAQWIGLLPDRIRDLGSGTVRQAIAGLFAPEVWPALPALVRDVLVFGTGAAGLLAIVASLRQLRRGPLVHGGACGLWLVALVLTDVTWRYVLPVLPVFFALVCRFAGRWWPWCFAAFALLSLPAGLAQLQPHPECFARMWREEIPVQGYRELSRAVRSRVPEGAVLGSDIDAWLYLQTRRRAVMPAPTPENVPEGLDAAALAALCEQEWERLGVTHLVVEPLLGEPERSIVLEAWRRGDFTELAAGLPPGFHVLQRRR